MDQNSNYYQISSSCSNAKYSKFLSIIDATLFSAEEGRRKGRLLLNHWFGTAYGFVSFVILMVLWTHATRIADV